MSNTTDDEITSSSTNCRSASVATKTSHTIQGGIFCEMAINEIRAQGVTE